MKESAMTSLSPRRALILIDVQNEYVGGGLPIEYPDVHLSLERIAQAAEAARTHGIPIVLVRQNAPAGAPIFAPGSHGWEFHPVVATLKDVLVIDKLLPSALTGWDQDGLSLGDWLRREEISILTLAGYMIHNCVDSTARQAVHEGWEVEILADASGALPYANLAGEIDAKTLFTAFTIVQQSRFAAVADTADWIAALESGAKLPRDTIPGSNLKARTLKG